MNAAFSLSYRDILPAYKSLNIQISTEKNIVTHIVDRTIVGQGEQLGIRFLRSPKFEPGNKRVIPANLDDRSDTVASTVFCANPAEISGGTLIEEAMIPRFAYQYGGSPAEAPHYGRTLRSDTDYVLIIKNEGFSPTDVMLNLVFYETNS